MKVEPWQDISITSSFVNERGPLKTVTTTSSMIRPSSSMLPTCTVCVGTFAITLDGKTADVMSNAFGPDKRITPIAPMPCGLASATMVSVWLVMGCVLKIYSAVSVKLLEKSSQVVVL